MWFHLCIKHHTEIPCQTWGYVPEKIIVGKAAVDKTKAVWEMGVRGTTATINTPQSPSFFVPSLNTNICNNLFKNK
jgi:hypothetical protein